jgi:hypothetical protein
VGYGKDVQRAISRDRRWFNTMSKMDAKKFTNPVFLFNAFVLAGFIILEFVVSGYSEGARRFPEFVLGIGITVIVLWMVIYFVFPGALYFIETQEESEETDTANMKRFFLACVCVVLSVLVGYLLGFLFLVPAVFLGYGFMLADRKNLRIMIIAAIVTTALFYLGFDYLLNIPLLNGVILDLS